MKYKVKLIVWIIVLIGIFLLIYQGWKSRYIHYIYTKAVWSLLVQDEFAKCNDGLFPDASFLSWNKKYEDNLISLRLGGKYKDLTPISRLNLVDIIHLNGTRVKNLEFTKGMTNLKAIYVDNQFLNSLSGVENHKELFELCILDASRISDLKPLANMTVNYLILNDLPSDDIKVLTSMKIQYLSLEGENIIDISSVAKITGLTMLNLSNTGVKDLTPLGNTKIKYLFLSDTPITSLEPLAKMENLIKLDISYTKVSSLAPLAKLDKLFFLNIDGTPITSLAPLNELKLQSLYIKGTPVAKNPLPKWTERIKFLEK